MLSTDIKRQAKALKNHTKLSHANAQELLARSYRCADYHELQQLVKTRSEDRRLNGASINPSSFPGTADDWESTLNHQAEIFASTLGLSLPIAADLVAVTHGFSNSTSIEYQTLDDFISSSEVFYRIDQDLGDELSGSIAETNAFEFSIDDYEIISCDYDEEYQRYIVTMDITYTGEQDPDKPYHGNQFHPRVNVSFMRENALWQYDSLSINYDVNYNDREDDGDEEFM